MGDKTLIIIDFLHLRYLNSKRQTDSNLPTVPCWLIKLNRISPATEAFIDVTSFCIEAGICHVRFTHASQLTTLGVVRCIPQSESILA